MRRQGILVWTIAVLALGTSACGKTKYTCPGGYHLIGTGCYPNEETPATDTGGGADVTSIFDLGKADLGAKDLGEPADAEEVDANAPPIDVVKADAKTDVPSPPKKGVGAACIDDFDCVSGVLTCYAWPGGYCSATSCKDVGALCPGASLCWSSGKADLCVGTCDDNTDCRPKEGYACKRLSQTFGGVDAKFCLPGGKGALGAGCTGPLDCGGTATCLTDMAGGYCGRLGCGSSDPCDAGSSCILRGGKPTCMKTCLADSDCQISTKEPRKCVQKTDLTKKPVLVCSDSSKANPVGASCLADLDCETKLCVIYAKGTCSTGGAPCINDAQCGAGAPCVLDPAAEKGSCGSPCSVDKGCPINSVCVPGVGSAQAGTCQPGCKGPGDDATCTVPGLMCIYGDPLPPPAGSATAAYSCSAQPAGSAGASCTESSECKSGTCMTNAAVTAGYCASNCGSGLPPCNFGSVCVDTGLAMCMKRCSGDYDCPAQMACLQSPQAGGKVCLAP